MGFVLDTDASNAKGFTFGKHGDTIVGYYLGSFPHTSKFNPDKPTKKHVFETSEGIVSIIGPKFLNDALPLKEVGLKLQVVYHDDKDCGKGKQPMKLFKIWTDKDDIKAVGKVAFEKVEEPDYEQEEPLDVIQPAAPKAPARAVAPPQANQDRVRAILATRKPA